MARAAARFNRSSLSNSTAHAAAAAPTTPEPATPEAAGLICTFNQDTATRMARSLRSLGDSPGARRT
jgi:hypothetical protein